MQLTTDYRGIRTSIDPLSVPEGYLSRGENIRNDDGTISLRGGITQVKASGLTGTCIGSTIVEYNGNAYYFVAMNQSSVCRVYYFQYTGSSQTWGSAVEVTATSAAKYDVATQMAVPSEGQVTFTEAYTKSDGPVLIIQDGTSDPRIVKVSSLSAGCAEIIRQVPAIEELDGFKPLFTIADYLDLASGGSSVSSGAGTMAWSGSGDTWTLTTGAGPNVDNDFSQFDLVDTLDLGNGGRQIILIGTASSEEIWNCTKWELKCATQNVTIHDPESQEISVTRIPSNVPGLNIYAFPLGEFSPAERISGGGGSGACDGIRVTLTNVDIAASVTFDLYGVFLMGDVPGTAEYSLAWENSGSLSEGPEIVLPNPTIGPGISQLFVGASSDLDPDFRLPLSPALYYRVYLPTVAPDSDLRDDDAVDTINIYRRDPGEAYRYLVQSVTAASYSSGWSYDSPYSGGVRQNYTDSTVQWDKDFTRIAPSAFNEPVPKGRAGLFANSRLYFGTFKASANDGATVIKVSDKDEPMRFRSIPDLGFGEESGFLAQLNGDETVQAFSAVSASVVGSSLVYAFTSRGIRAINGTQLYNISDIGSRAPYSVTNEQNTAYFLDADLQVRTLGSNIGELSRYTVDDQFNSVTPTDVSFARHRGRLYCLTDNNTVVVWSDRLRDWESVDGNGAELTFLKFLPWRILGETKLYITATDGDLYEYEQGNTDDGSQIALGISWQEFRDRDWLQLRMRDPYIVCSDKDSETGTFAFVAKNPADTATGTASLDAGSGETTNWRKFSNSGKDIGVRGCSILPKFDCTVSGSFKIYGFKVTTNLDAGRGAKT